LNDLLDIKVTSFEGRETGFPGESQLLVRETPRQGVITCMIEGKKKMSKRALGTTGGELHGKEGIQKKGQRRGKGLVTHSVRNGKMVQETSKSTSGKVKGKSVNTTNGNREMPGAMLRVDRRGSGWNIPSKETGVGKARTSF